MKIENLKPSPSRHVVLGTAGHIDHGKTAIVKRLTGTDTDRLKEEKERGMTTDLGFAFLGDGITMIDVPGHERFVKTMVAGVNTIDLALLVVAADDGVMPQTLEHLEILHLLRIPAGLVAVNKIDLVEKDWLDLVLDDVRKRLRGTALERGPIVPVSAMTGEGMDRLKGEILRMAGEVRSRHDKGIFRMPVDRVFTIKGFGTVLAGTVLSGRVAPEDTVELLPRGLPLRVRGVQVHERAVQEGRVGFRTAVNVMGVEKEAVERGNVLAEPGFYRPTRIADAHFSLLAGWTRPLKNRERVHAHVGTDEALARIVLLDRESLAPGADGFVQLHFEKPVVVDTGDRFVVRSYSPMRTIGGGVVLDAYPAKHRRANALVIERLKRLMQGDAGQAVLEHLERARFHPVSADDLAKTAGSNPETVRTHLLQLEKDANALRVGKDRWVSRTNREALERRLMSVLADFHAGHPERAGMQRAELLSRIRPAVDKALFEDTVKSLVQHGALFGDADRIRLAGHRVSLSPALERVKEQAVAGLLASPFSPPDEKEFLERFGEDGRTVVQVLVESGDLVRLEEGVLFHRDGLEQAKSKIRSYLVQKGEATVSDLRQLLGTTRKYAVPLVEYLDRIGFTEREGDMRRLKGRE